MLKKFALVLALMILVGSGAWAEIELGFGIAPPIGEVPEGAQQGGFLGDATKVLHAGFSFWYLFYVCYDGLILPPYSVQSMTQTIDNSGGGSTQPGYLRPGFLNTFDIGFRPRFGPLTLMAAIGVNQLYIFRQGPDDLKVPSMGVNVKAGVGWRLAKWIGLYAIGTVAFADFNTMKDTFNGLDSDNPDIKKKSEDAILNNIYPVILLTLYL